MSLSTLGENLRRLRVNRGLTQAELASRAGISRLAYSNIETAKSEPRSSTIQQIADVLEVPILELISEVPQIRQVRFRASKKLHREQILATVANWLKDRASIERMLEIGPVEDSIQAFIERHRPRGKKPEVVAALVRSEAWKLPNEAPISDICGRLERWGVRVLPHPFQSDRFFGLAVAPEGGGPAVVVNVWDRISVERWIFSAAHELGHLLLHHDAFDVTKEEEEPEEERQANIFAGHLLMPDSTFAARWNESPGLSLVERILKIKRMFLVSWKTVAYRLCEHNSGKTTTIWQACYAGFKARGLRVGAHDEVGPSKPEAFSEQMRADEPATLLPQDFVPAGFGGAPLRNLIFQAIQKEKISVPRAAEILKVDISTVRQMYDDWCHVFLEVKV